MQSVILLTTIILLIIIITYYLIIKGWKFKLNQTTNVVSNVDGLSYKVHAAHIEHQLAADTMAMVNHRLIELMRYLKKYNQNKELITQILKRYNPDRLVENSPRNPDNDTSYTVNKGDLLALCIRDSKTDQIHDLDTLTFVAIHELAHIAIDDIAHTKTFWKTFRFLLKNAQDANVYISRDYANFPDKYCGLIINYNPLYDDEFN